MSMLFNLSLLPEINVYDFYIICFGMQTATYQIQLIMERDEAAKPHSDTIRRFLRAAVAVYDPSRPYRTRFKGLQHLQLADELAADEVSPLFNLMFV